MAEHEKDFEVIEETEKIVVEEKPSLRARVAEKLSAVPKKAKYIAAGVAGAAAMTGIGFAITARREVKRTREELVDQGLTIEDVPELQSELESEFGHYAEA